MAPASNTLVQQTIAQLQRHPPFDRLEQTHLEWLAQRLEMAYYAAGDVLISPEQGIASRFFIIRQGLVEGRRGAANAETSITDELQQGDIFPLSSLLAKREVGSTFRALDDVFCLELSAEDFYQFLRLSETFNDYCTRRIANLLEQSMHSVQAEYSQSSSEGQSMSSQLSSVIRRSPVTCSPDTPMREVLGSMNELSIGSMIVVDDGKPVGIFTLYDLLGQVALAQINPDQPIVELMNTRLFTLPPQSLAYEAALVMAREAVRHVLVTNQDKIVGVVSEKDLFTLQRVGLRQISTAIRQAEDLETLQQCARDIHYLARNMLAQGVAAEQLTQFISTLNDLLTTQIITLELVRAQNEPGWQEIDFCWLAMGSEGRYEQTMNTDQDNGIIFVTPQGMTENQVRERLLPIAKAINVALDSCGFPLCKGDIMASNSQWCLNMTEWENLFSRWIFRGDAQELLNASIFFDFRPIYGNHDLAHELRHWLNSKVRGNRMFMRKMVENALSNHPPLSLLKRFLVDKKGENLNTLDLKFNGVTPFVDAARIFALESNSLETGTIQRLRGAAKAWRMDQAETDAWVESFLYIQLLRLRLQHQQKERGQVMTNRINPETLNALDQRILKETFRQARQLQGVLEKYYSF